MKKWIEKWMKQKPIVKIGIIVAIFVLIAAAGFGTYLLSNSIVQGNKKQEAVISKDKETADKEDIEAENQENIENENEENTENENQEDIESETKKDTVVATIPKKVILFIGDGMGKNHIANTALFYNKTLAMQTINNKAEVTTFSLNAAVTDSAAAGTALATGYKTNNSMVGLMPDASGQITLQNLCELARAQQKKVGIVTTDELTGATPAAFSSHVTDRTMTANIAMQQVAFAPNVLFGGHNEAYDSVVGSFKGNIVRDSTELSNLRGSNYALGLFFASSLGYGATEDGTPSILDMTKKAIELLDNENGFFLMVEGAHIDKHSHSNDIRMMAKSLYEMDLAIEYALEYAKNDQNTIVIITADHETGSLALANSANEIADTLYASGEHSGQNVPLYAYGIGASRFSGVMDNTDVAKTIASFMTNNAFGSKEKYTR